MCARPKHNRNILSRQPNPRDWLRTNICRLGKLGAALLDCKASQSPNVQLRSNANNFHGGAAAPPSEGDGDSQHESGEIFPSSGVIPSPCWNNYICIYIYGCLYMGTRISQPQAHLEMKSTRINHCSDRLRFWRM